MNEQEVEEFHTFWQYFCKELLSTLVSTGASICLLCRKDVEQLIADGLLEKSTHDWGLRKSLKMVIYAVGEPNKKRRRLIIWTRDINEQCPNPQMTPFNPFDSMLEEGMAGVGWNTDSKACYHQFRLPEDAKPYYTFNYDGIGLLNLTTVPTGQRHTVGMAQTVSRFIMRKTIDTSEVMSKTFRSVHESYIDNFRAVHPCVKMAKISLANFYSTVSSYGVTINESMKEAAAQVGQPYTYRGVLFTSSDHSTPEAPTPAVTLGGKTRDKLQWVLQLLSQSTEAWTMADADAVFGLCIYASTIFKLHLTKYYYVFKFFRRRHNLLARGIISYSSLARIWPSIVGDVIDWVTTLLSMPPRHSENWDPETADVLFTDASCYGWGAMLFKKDGTTAAIGGQWSAKERVSIIAELEAKALLLGLEALVGDRTVPIVVFIDNTTVGYCFARRRSRHYYINKTLHQLAEWKIISLEYVRSEDNLADGISRGADIDTTLRRVSWIGGQEKARCGHLDDSSYASVTQTQTELKSKCDWKSLMQYL